MENQILHSWPKVLKILESETSPVSYQTWFQSLKPVQVHENTLFIETYDNFYKRYSTTTVYETLRKFY